MDGFSTTAVAKILNVFTGQAITPFGTGGKLYLGLSTQEPAFDGSGFVEPAGSTGYVRQEITVDTSSWSTPANRLIQTLNNIFFPDVTTTDWEQIVAAGLFEAASGGTPIVFCGVDLPRIVKIGNGFYFPAGSGKLRFQKVSGTTTSLEYANSLLNVFRGISPQILSNVFLGFGTKPVKVTNDVIDYGELAVAGYERLKVPADATNWGITAPRTLKNLLELKLVKEADLPTLVSQADTDWEALKSFAIYASVNATAPMYVGPLQKDAIIYKNDIPRIAVNKIVVTM